MSKEIFVAFATQKGGIGKSTVTALAASYLHNVKGYNVAVVDWDDPQHSIHGEVYKRQARYSPRPAFSGGCPPSAPSPVWWVAQGTVPARQSFLRSVRLSELPAPSAESRPECAARWRLTAVPPICLLHSSSTCNRKKVK